jgi:hypothetical protein
MAGGSCLIGPDAERGTLTVGAEVRWPAMRTALPVRHWLQSKEGAHRLRERRRVDPSTRQRSRVLARRTVAAAPEVDSGMSSTRRGTTSVSPHHSAIGPRFLFGTIGISRDALASFVAEALHLEHDRYRGERSDHATDFAGAPEIKPA